MAKERGPCTLYAMNYQRLQELGSGGRDRAELLGVHATTNCTALSRSRPQCNKALLLLTPPRVLSDPACAGTRQAAALVRFERLQLPQHQQQRHCCRRSRLPRRERDQSPHASHQLGWAVVVGAAPLCLTVHALIAQPAFLLPLMPTVRAHAKGGGWRIARQGSSTGVKK